MIQVLLRHFETNAVKSKLNRYVVEEVRQFRILSKAQNYFFIHLSEHRHKRLCYSTKFAKILL